MPFGELPVKAYARPGMNCYAADRVFPAADNCIGQGDEGALTAILAPGRVRVCAPKFARAREAPTPVGEHLVESAMK